MNFPPSVRRPNVSFTSETSGFHTAIGHAPSAAFRTCGMMLRMFICATSGQGIPFFSPIFVLSRSIEWFPFRCDLAWFTPQHGLPCGHIIYENCVVLFGDYCKDDPYIFKIHDYFLCEAELSEELIVKINPRTVAGVAVLCIDGGGARGIWRE